MAPTPINFAEQAWINAAHYNNAMDNYQAYLAKCAECAELDNLTAQLTAQLTARFPELEAMDDDGIDLFGSDDDEEDAAAEILKVLFILLPFQSKSVSRPSVSWRTSVPDSPSSRPDSTASKHLSTCRDTNCDISARHFITRNTPPVLLLAF